MVLRRANQKSGARVCVCGKTTHYWHKDFWQKTRYSTNSRVVVKVLCGQGLFSELLLQKDGSMMVGCIKDTRTCVDMEVHMCTGGGQLWKQSCSTGCSTVQDWVLYVKEAGYGMHGTCV